ncbi:MAG TPA: MFS transporter, partial [Anaerolineales bacterium]|nr:MFS transporter [Anaerolineales bacterium]
MASCQLGVGITLGPIIMTLGLGATETWHTGYRIVGGFQLFLAACFVLTLPMWSDNDKPATHDEPKKLTDYKTPMGETMRQPRVWMSALLFFLYVGAEGALGTWIYTLLTESRGIDPTVAGFWAGSYWATFTVGRVIAGLFANRIGINKLVIGGLLGALVGAVLLVWNPSSAV